MFKLNLMERSPMTDEMMNLRSLVEKSADWEKGTRATLQLYLDDKLSGG